MKFRGQEFNSQSLAHSHQRQNHGQMETKWTTKTSCLNLLTIRTCCSGHQQDPPSLSNKTMSQNGLLYNNLRLNSDKTREVLIIKRGKHRPPPIPGILRVVSITILGVTINENLQASNHVENLLSVCSSTFSYSKPMGSQSRPYI